MPSRITPGPDNNIWRITAKLIAESDLKGQALLLEALLRRGFLAYKEKETVWLGTGSHPNDIEVLHFVDGLVVTPIAGHADRIARLEFSQSLSSESDVAQAIISLPENHLHGHGLWTSAGLGPHVRPTWTRFRHMHWGAKLAVCPMKAATQNIVENALDVGVALLVKTLPLARVATTYSCDGHGQQQARISLHYELDAIWGASVFEHLMPPPRNSVWTWSSENGSSLMIEPVGGYGDDEVKGMLDDIQTYSRRLLEVESINRIGLARRATLETFAKYPYPPSANIFAVEARRRIQSSMRGEI